uniref:Uncharacterized protein n=1 Tax=Meloidogyne enterolobii TaxID=390850 RepID=A0A6V7XHN8_MELEN|nr:unnamed protein product [Meloidogyne enterolobii]
MKFFKFPGPACCLHGWFGLDMFFKNDGAMVEQPCLVGGCVVWLLFFKFFN